MLKRLRSWWLKSISPVRYSILCIDYAKQIKKGPLTRESVRGSFQDLYTEEFITQTMRLIEAELHYEEVIGKISKYLRSNSSGEN